MDYTASMARAQAGHGVTGVMPAGTGAGYASANPAAAGPGAIQAGQPSQPAQPGFAMPTMHTLALNHVNFTLREGETVAVMGPSGSGKSTLMHTLAGLDSATSGHILFGGADLTRMDDKQLTLLRRHKIGFIFQSFNLLPMFTAEQNILMPLTLAGDKPDHAWFDLLVDTLGLKQRLNHRPNELSGGQQQRVAIARALATNPKVLLCDEATSALDPKTTRQILELIGDINKKLGITVVIITHQMSVVKEVCNHVAILDDGEVVEEGLVSTVFSAPKSAAARHLVFPRGADIDVSDPQQQRRIRLIFRSAKTTSIPLVARLATEEGISATVISANTQKLSEEVYGSMLLGVPNAQFEQAMDFLRSIENLQVEEASVDVQ